jgi:hypothetical protein
MAKTGWILFFIMMLIAAAMAYNFIYRGKVELAPDGRTAVLLGSSERDFVLLEMRTFLEAVQQISQGIENDDMQIVTKAARKVGSAELVNVPGTLMAKLPLAFKTMGLSVHKSFDQMAMDAEQLGDKDHTQSQLNQILPTCTTCHSLYSIKL